jgi:dipeptide transport system permease protein
VGTLIMRLMDIILTLPSLLLAIAIVAILGPGLMNAMLAVAVVILPHYVRLTRAAAFPRPQKDYVTGRAWPAPGTLRLMFSERAAQLLAPLIVQASLGFSTAILDAAALGFLGLGAQPPSPEWGTMLADAREFVCAPGGWSRFPGVMILVTVLAFNLLGDGLRDAFDPKLKR